MSTRILTAADAAIYRALRLQALQCNAEAFLTTYEEYLSRPEDQIAAQLQPSEYNFTLGAFTDEGRLAGTVTLIRERPTKTRHIASVQGMFVSADIRGNGVGRTLLSHLIREARQLPELEQLRLTVVADNTTAASLYESLGFRTFGVERHALKMADSYSDELHMVLSLVNEADGVSPLQTTTGRGFSHVTINVIDLVRSLEFYTGTLGMKLVHRGRRDAYVEWGTAWVCLQERPAYLSTTPQAGVDHVAFFIDPDEFHPMATVLRQSGVPIIRGPIERGGGWTVNFLDPDGSQLEFHTATLAQRMVVWQ